MNPIIKNRDRNTQHNATIHALKLSFRSNQTSNCFIFRRQTLNYSLRRDQTRPIVAEKSVCVSNERDKFFETANPAVIPEIRRGTNGGGRRREIKG